MLYTAVVKENAALNELSGFLAPSRRRLLEAHAKRLPDPAAGLRLLERWEEKAGLPSGEASFIHLLYLASSSETLFLGLMRRPEALGALSAQVARSGGLTRIGMEEALARTFLAEKELPEGVLAGFRVFQTARILIQDVLRMEPPETIMRELSFLADVLIDKAFSLTYQSLREEMGLPLRTTRDGRTTACPLAVFALGKLGGSELNYASDVDLVCFYRSEGSTDRGVSNRTFFNAWVKAAAALLTASTPYGPCLKVDTDLRPRGRDGELTMSFDGALSYYADFADLWERQAWIKARGCAGDPEACALFLGRMEPIVYRPYSSEGIAEEVGSLRKKAVKKLSRAGHGESERNIKEGPGGIRDAEFTVQALQMAHGSDDRWIREGCTLLALHKLEQKGYLPGGERLTTAKAYLLLRRTEHWAQFRAMRQCHDLPTTEQEWDSLDRYLRIGSADQTRAEIKKARERLKRIFDRVIEGLGAGTAVEEEVKRLLSPEGLRESLRSAGLRDVELGVPMLERIAGNLVLDIDTPVRRRRFLRVFNSLKNEVASAPDPLRGLAGLSKLVDSFSGDSDITPLLLDRTKLARLLFRLISRSERMLELLTSRRYLLESLNYASMHNVEGEIRSMERGVFDPDLVRKAHEKVLFLVSAREIVTGEKLEWAELRLTDLAESVLSAVFTNACRRVEEEESLPGGTLKRKLVLVALGRLGFREMHPRSDLDLVCVKDAKWVLPSDPDRSARAESNFMRTLAGGLTAVTRHGGLYDLDLRLRPYGESGPQVQSKEAYHRYFSGPARLWERTAYLKGRAVAGNLDLGRNLLDALHRLIMERGASKEETNELLALRGKMERSAVNLEEKIKFRPGGLLDLDILLLVLQIRNGVPAVDGGTGGLMERLLRAGAIGEAEKADLYKARLFQDALLHRCRLHLSRPPSLRAASSALERLGRYWSASACALEGVHHGSNLEKDWNESASTVQVIAERYLQA